MYLNSRKNVRRCMLSIGTTKAIILYICVPIFISSSVRQGLFVNLAFFFFQDTNNTNYALISLPHVI